MRPWCPCGWMSKNEAASNWISITPVPSYLQGLSRIGAESCCIDQKKDLKFLKPKCRSKL